MKLFLATLQFMTRLPIPSAWINGFDFNTSHKGIIWFPLVGVIVGLFSTSVFYCGDTVFGWTPTISAVLYLMVAAMVTGGFHLDGLADTFDGVFSARTRERMLDIMKDSRLGTHGGLALIFVLLLKVLFIAQLAELHPEQYLAILMTGPVVSRACVAILMYQQHYAREKGLGHLYIGRITGVDFLLCLGMGLMFCLVLGGSVWGMLIVIVFGYGFRRYLNGVLGGQTGDTLGAGNELFELVYLLAVQL